MSSKHLIAQLFPAPDNPVMMMRRDRSPASGSAWAALAGGLDKLHRSFPSPPEDVDGAGAGVPEDQQAVGLKTQLIHRFLQRHRLGVGPADHHGRCLVGGL